MRKSDNVAGRDDSQRKPEMRLDVWLWATRFFKTRSIAKKSIESSHVHLNGRDARASASLRTGDRLSISRGDERFEIEVVGLIKRRESAPVARAKYVESAESIAARLAAAEKRRMMRDGYEKPPTKPDKRARRLIKALGDIDAM